jgi:hypothetical protein
MALQHHRVQHLAFGKSAIANGFDRYSYHSRIQQRAVAESPIAYGHSGVWYNSFGKV